jgi:hypothetical protein
MFTLQPEIPWRIDHGFNPDVDFCIWVLELDGLHVPTFDQHSQGNSQLQTKGIDTKSWCNWLSTVVALQDSILQWNKYSQNQQLFIEEQLTTFKTMHSRLVQQTEWSNEQINLTTLRSILDIHVISYEQQYQAAARLVSHLPGTFKSYLARPFDAFLGSPTVRELLFSLWQRYELIWDKERLKDARIQGEQTRLTGETSTIWQDLQYLNIYVVNYPTPVEYLVPPVSVIVSFANELVPKSDAFDQFVMRTAKKLAQSQG